MRIEANPHAAIAQLGSSFAISWNVASPCDHQNECSMATPRVTFCCTFGLHELGKFTLPSFCTDWLAASSSCARALQANIAATAINRRIGAPCLEFLQIEALAV